MPNFILFEDNSRISLRPLTFFRPVCAIRIGILTIYEKWEAYLQQKVSFLAEVYLQEKFPLRVSHDNYLINGAILPNMELVNEILALDPDTILLQNDTIIALHLTAENLKHFTAGSTPELRSKETSVPIKKIQYTWDIIRLNEQAIIDDFDLVTRNRKSAKLSETNQVSGNNLFIEEGASVDCSSINTLHGPVYIGHNAEIMQGCHIQGPVAICDHATFKMGSLVYKGTTLGPWCKAGGEISNSVMFGYSAKAHDGYLGDSVIAEWCNLGAGTITSNLKNNYEEVKQWSYNDSKFVDTGLQFCGLVMGDHCKTGIGTMFNSGTTTGVCSNIFGVNYQRNFIKSFVWGGTSGFRNHKLSEVVETATAVYNRRKLPFTATEEKIFNAVYELTANNRRL